MIWWAVVNKLIDLLDSGGGDYSAAGGEHQSCTGCCTGDGQCVDFTHWPC